MFRCQPLNGHGDQLAGAVVGCLAGFHFDLANNPRHIIARVQFNRIQQFLPRFIDGHLGDALQFLNDLRL